MQKLLLFLSTFFFLCTASFSHPVPLPEEKAFQFSLTIKNPRELLATWQIAPGYYLYAKKMQFVFDPKIKANIRLPQGEFKYDLNQKRYEAYANNVSVPILLSADVKSVQLNVSYQGCSQNGFCYPPLHKNLTVALTTSSITNAPTEKISYKSLLSNQQGIQTLLQTKEWGFILFLFTGLGLLLGFTPCVFPMIPILTSIIVGQKEKVNSKKAFLLSLTYVLGTAITYAIAGLIAASIGSSLQVSLQKPWIITTVSSIFVLLALSLFGFYELRLPQKIQNRLLFVSNQQQGGTYAGVFIMGMLSTLIVSPCITAPLAGILLYIGQSGDHLLGAGALFATGFGMGIPLLLIGTTASKWLPKSGAWMNAIKIFFGLLMLGMALWLMSRFIPPIWKNTPAYSENSFVTIHNMADLNQQLLIAKTKNKRALLDFYADWCESCVVMDRRVFASAPVQHALSNYMLIRADLSENSADDEALLKYFKVIAPPTVLFFNEQGREISTARIIGEVDATEFLNRVQKNIKEKNAS